MIFVLQIVYRNFYLNEIQVVRQFITAHFRLIEKIEFDYIIEHLEKKILF